jgi:glycosyltransferase involved in cell wall biosynthesis
VRIAQLTSRWLPTGGVATYVRLLSGALAEAGHEVLVVHGEAGDAVEASPGGVHVAAAPGAFRSDESASRVAGSIVRAELREFKPDVVHLHGTNNFPLEAAIQAEYAALKTLHVYDFCPSGTKFHHRTDQACVESTTWRCVPHQIFRRCTLSKRPGVIWSQYTHAVAANDHHRAFDTLIVASDFVKREAIRTGFDVARVHVLPYFTTLPSTVRGAETRDVLFVGRLTREKGADLLIDAMATIPPPWRCVIAGEGMDRTALRVRANEMGLADRVVFAGWLTGDALADAYRRAAVVVVPSRWPEPFGIVGIEAFAFVRPVVAFRVGGIPEWLDDGVSGYAIAPHDAGAMSERIQFLLDHPAEAAAMGTRGRARVDRDFTVEPHLARLMPLYEHVRDDAHAHTS